MHSISQKATFKGWLLNLKREGALSTITKSPSFGDLSSYLEFPYI